MFEIIETGHSHWVYGNYSYLYDDGPDRASNGNPKLLSSLFPGMPAAPWQAAERAPMTSSGFLYVTKAGENLYWLFDTLSWAPVPGFPQPFLPVADSLCEVFQERSSLVGVIEDKVAGDSLPYQPNLSCEWFIVAPQILTHPYPPSLFDREYYQATYSGMRLDFTRFNLTSNPDDHLEIWATTFVANYTARVMIANFSMSHPPPLYTYDGGVTSAAVTVSSNYTVVYLVFKTYTRVSGAPLGNGWSVIYSMLPSTSVNVTNIRATQTLVSLPNLGVGNTPQYQYLRFKANTQTPTSLSTCIAFVTLDHTQLNAVPVAFPGNLTSQARVIIRIYGGLIPSESNFIGNNTGLGPGVQFCKTIEGFDTATIELIAPPDLTVYAFTRTFVQSTCKGYQEYNTTVDGWIDDGSADQDYVRDQICQWLVISYDPDALFVSFTLMNFDLQITDTPDSLSFFDGTFTDSTSGVLTDTTGRAASYGGALSQRRIFSDTHGMLVQLTATFADGQADRRGGFNGTYTIVYTADMNRTTFTGIESWLSSSSSFSSSMFQPLSTSAASGTPNSSLWLSLNCTVGSTGTLHLTSIDKLNRQTTADNYSPSHFRYYLRFVYLGSAPSEHLVELMTNVTFDTSLLSTWGARVDSTPNTAWSTSLPFTAPTISGAHFVSLILITKGATKALVVQNAIWPISITPISTPSGARSVIDELPSTIIAGSETKFYVLMRDSYDNSVARGGYPKNTVRVFTQAITSNAFPLMTVTDLNDGRQEMTFTPTIADSYRVSILVSGHDVMSSPVDIIVLPNIEPSSDKTILNLANVVQPVPPGTDIIMHVALRDTWGNELSANNVSIDSIDVFVGLYSSQSKLLDADDGNDAVSITPQFAVNTSSSTITMTFSSATPSIIRVRVKINGAHIQGSPSVIQNGVIVLSVYSQPASVEIALVLVSAVMIVVQFVLTGGVIRLRDHMVIKSASPLFCFFILIGAMVWILHSTCTEL
jgi:hypothetical protein